MNRARRSQEGGVIAVIVAVALFAVLMIAGLALDSGHVFSNKARFQNVLDAAALAAARTLDETEGNTVAASLAATTVFNANKSAFPALAATNVTPVIEYSNTLAPPDGFVPGSTPARYVRVTATNFRTPTTLSRLAGVNEFVNRASAVAGPSPTINTACNIVPMMVCGVPGAPQHGFVDNRIEVLKIGAQGSTALGPGNFMLIQLGGSGASVVRENLAGGYQGCASMGETVNTQPGNEAGPLAQGINTRFGIYQGGGVSSTAYPPDVVTDATNLCYDSDLAATRERTGGGGGGGGGGGACTGDVVTQASEIDYNFAQYEQQVAAGQYDNTPIEQGGIGAFDRRKVAVTIADCSGQTNGASTLPVMGFGCFFLLQPAEQSGLDSYVFAQYLEDCLAGGTPGPAPTTVPGPHIIQLYRSPTSPDS